MSKAYPPKVVTGYTKLRAMAERAHGRMTRARVDIDEIERAREHLQDLAEEAQGIGGNQLCRIIGEIGREAAKAVRRRREAMLCIGRVEMRMGRSR